MAQTNSTLTRRNERETRDESSRPGSAALVRPMFSVKEDQDAYQITVHLPGVSKDGLEVTAQQREITIVGRRSWTLPSEWTVLFRETPRADFGLTLSHGGDIDADKINAEMKDGVLRLTLPKAEAYRPRKISIQ